MGFPYRRKSIISGVTNFGPSLILYDDMDSTLKWTNEGSGNATLTKNTDAVYTGQYSLRATSDPGVIAMGDTVGASRNIIIRPGGIVRLNQLFIPSHSDELYTLEWKIEYIHNGKLYTVSLTYFTVQEAWLYLDANGNYQIAPNITHILANDKWHFLELVFNTQTHKFVSFTIDNTLSDLNNIAYKNEINASDPYGKFTFTGTLTVGVAHYMSVWLDSISIIAE